MAAELKRRLVPRTDPSGHLTLLHDLVSPSATVLPASTPAQIALQLSALDAKPLAHLLRTLALSASLWPPSERDVPLQRAIDVFTALVRGFLLRIDGIAADDEANVEGRTGFGLGPGWRGRRELAGVVETVVAAAEQPAVRPDVRLLIVSALLAALQAVKQRRDELYVGGRQLIPRAETAVLAAWQALLEPGVLSTGAQTPQPHR